MFKYIAVWKELSDKIASGQSGNKQSPFMLQKKSLFQRIKFFIKHQMYLHFLAVTPKVLTIVKKIYYLHY